MEIKRTQQSLEITKIESDQRTEVSKLKPVVPNQIPDSFEDASGKKDAGPPPEGMSESAIPVDPKSQALLLQQMTSARLLQSGIKIPQQKPLAAKVELATNEQKAKLESALQNNKTAETQARVSQPMYSGGGRPDADESKKEESKSNSSTYTITRYTDYQENGPNVKGRIILNAKGDENSAAAGIGGEAQAQVYAANYETGIEYAANIAGHDVTIKQDLKFKTEAGAKGELIAEAVAFDGENAYVYFGVEQFVGVKAEVEGTHTVEDYGSVHGGVGQSVGYGFSGSVQIGMKDGKAGIHLDDVGLAVFYGFTLDAGFDVDVSKMSELSDSTTEEGFEFARSLWEPLETAGDFAQKAAGSSKGVVEDMRERMENMAEEAAESAETAEDVAEEAVETAEEVVEDVVEDAEEAAENTAEEIEDAWNDFWD
jgi:hypothetical protein